jgi:hypothetical protein
VLDQAPHFKKVKHFNSAGHAHELTFSCYRRYNYLNDSDACDIFLAEPKRHRQEGSK